MNEDKLTHDERLRLEALNQAVISCGYLKSTEEIISRATRFEKFLKDGGKVDKVKPTQTKTQVGRMHA